MRFFPTFSSICLAGAIAFGPAVPAGAASSAWHENQGGNIRILSTGLPDSGGTLRAVMQIDLARGWHTYWRDPGETGVAPSISVTSSTEPVAVGFPAPSRLEDGSVGYAEPVSLPLTIRIDPAAAGRPLEVKVFIGVCREICLPVNATLTIDPKDGADDPVDARAVAEAFAALPGQPSAGFGLTASVSKPLEIMAQAALPPGASGAELFLAGDGAFAFGVPEKVSEADGKAVFRIAALSVPAALHPERAFRYVLKADGKAVEGTVTLPGL